MFTTIPRVEVQLLNHVAGPAAGSGGHPGGRTRVSGARSWVCARLSSPTESCYRWLVGDGQGLTRVFAAGWHDGMLRDLGAYILVDPGLRRRGLPASRSQIPSRIHAPVTKIS